MTTRRSTLRFLVWSFLLGVVLLSSRKAMATAVPMCDERGASAIAPTPVLPIGDTKLEAAPTPPFACDDGEAWIAPAGPRAKTSSPAQSADSFEDVWMKPEGLGLRPVSSPQKLPSSILLFARRAGHRRDVFRPPRA